MSEDKEKYINSLHITPKRRLTRQRSGFSVSGKHTGSECLVGQASRFKTERESVSLVISQPGIKLVSAFGLNEGMVGFGGFIKPANNLLLEVSLKANHVGNEKQFSAQYKTKIASNNWSKFGIHLMISLIPDLPTDADALAKITLTSLNKTQIDTFDMFGINLDSVTYYEEKENLYEFFNEQTELYLPEIYYLEHDEAFVVEAIVDKEVKASLGETIVLKACNRCARFLPIDIDNERNALSFSNHCVKRAPCVHNAFSKYLIDNQKDSEDILDLKPVNRYVIKDASGQSKITSHLGFQLECRVCKKFVVNAPLNPLRNAAQHREDSLRRRSIEDLLSKLLNIQWIFKNFRMKNNQEFDDYIWEKFGKRCFACGKKLATTSEMAIDHTLPLVYFWPLDESASCLCKTCNSRKHELFPYEFYQHKDKLIKLASITGLDKDMLLMRSKTLNKDALNSLTARVVWFFDEFLMQKDYQKIREGKLTADLIYASIIRVLKECEYQLDLVKEYQKITGQLPKSISLV